MNQPRSDVPAPLLVDDRVADAQLTHRRGQAREALTQVGLIEAATLSLASRIHLLKIEGEALFDVGEVSESICTLKRALDLSCDGPDNLRFDIVFSLLLRSTDFYGPADVVPQVAELRQLGSRIGDAYALSLLHLAVARLEGIRGHYLDAHRRLQTARQLAVETNGLPFVFSRHGGRVFGVLKWAPWKVDRACRSMPEKGRISRLVKICPWIVRQPRDRCSVFRQAERGAWIS